MKKLAFAFIAASLLAGGVAPAFADAEPIDLWILTGDPTYARLAGLTDQQIRAAAQMPAEKKSL